MLRAFSNWLCPTELDRARLLDNSVRIRRARTISVVAIGATLVSFAPRYGFWSLGLLAIVALKLGWQEYRVPRSARPQLHIASSVVLIQAVLAAAAARSGGPESNMLPWIVLPTAFAAARFRGQVVVADVVIGTLLLLAATLGVDAGEVASNPEGLLVAIVLMISITAIVFVLSAAEVEQRGEAVLDHLTGLLNRTSLQRRFEELAEQAALSNESISLVVLDLDYFKTINDQRGHATGDAVLRDVAYEVRKHLRSFELVYRLGGEEFLVVLPGASLDIAADVANRLRSALENARPGGLAVTASFGVSTAVGAAVQFDALFAQADASLYLAKERGRNRVEVARSDLPLAA
jgi:diguanylate cyclase (GGDEF)-like protein